jgi:hypothetical protein
MERQGDYAPGKAGAVKANVYYIEMSRLGKVWIKVIENKQSSVKNVSL